MSKLYNLIPIFIEMFRTINAKQISCRIFLSSFFPNEYSSVLDFVKLGASVIGHSCYYNPSLYCNR